MRLQFIFNNKEVKLTTILFKNINPLLNIDKIVYFKETNLSGNWLKKEFRYSFNNSTWSNWNTLTQQALTNLKFTNQPNFYIEVLYTRSSYNTASITDFYLFYDSTIGSQDDIIPGNIPYANLSLYNSPTDVSLENSASIYDTSARIDDATGTSLFFKKIIGLGGIVIRDAASGAIEIDVSGGTDGARYQNLDPVLKTVGGIVTGQTFFADNKTFAETMAAMFYPTLYPILVSPSSSFDYNQPYLHEINSIINFSFTASFNRGSINPDYGTDGFRSGTPNTYHYNGPGFPVPLNIPSNSGSNIQLINNYIVTYGIKNWNSTISYNAGEQPLDSIGNPYQSPYPGGTTSNKTVSIEGVYPLFGTTINITTLSKQPLISMITGNNIEIILVSESGGNKQSFEIPVAWVGSPTNRPLFGIETFNTFSGSWDYEGGNAASSKNMWNISDTNESIQGTLINYKRYVYNGVDRSSIRIRLKF